MNEREKVKKIEGIEFTISVNGIPANSIKKYELESTKPYSKYVPFDSVTITNSSDQNINLIINDNKNQTYFIPKGVIQTISNVSIYRLTIQNLDTTNAVNSDKIKLVISRSGMTIDKFTKDIAKNVFVQWFLGLR